MQIKKVAYVGTDGNDVLRWIDHLIEEAIVRELNLPNKELVYLKTFRYMTETVKNVEPDDSLKET